MATLTNLQTINGPDGNPAFVVVPYEIFVKKYAGGEGLIPHEVISATVDGATPMKAWREHLRMTQVDVASRLGVSQAAYAQFENAARPRKATLIKVAEAMGISLEQLDF